MNLPANVPRCTGDKCPSASNCQRYTERHLPKGIVAPFSALHLRRQPGDDACDGYMPVRLITTFDVEPSPTTANSPGPGTTGQRVATIISEQMLIDIRHIKSESKFVADLGMDSLDLIECVMAIEEEFLIEVEDSETERCATVADVIKLVEQKAVQL